MSLSVFNGVLQGIICCHVDDFLWAAEDRFERVIDSLGRDFHFGTEGNGCFHYLVVEICQKQDRISMSQRSFIEKLEQYRVTDICGE